MPRLLSKEERESLSRPERRALRRERREERRGESILAKLNIDWVKVDEKATELILDMAGIAMPPEEKMQAVIDELIDQIDDFCRWEGVGTAIGGFLGGTVGALAGAAAAQLLEQLDGKALEYIAGKFIEPKVQMVYDRLKEQGVIVSAKRYEAAVALVEGWSKEERHNRLARFTGTEILGWFIEDESGRVFVAE